MPHHPIAPNQAICASAFEAWQALPGRFTKHDRMPGRFEMAALADLPEVEVTHLHLDMFDRATAVAVVRGAESAGLFIDVRHDGIHVMVKGESIEALAKGLEVAARCASTGERG
jgi:hypothetical protein